MARSIHSCVLALCTAICTGTEEGEVFLHIRQELQALASAPWPDPAGDAAVREYIQDTPSHRQACIDLDFQGFSKTTPLVVGGLPMHLHHILEAFSRTSPQRYGAIWLILLDLVDVVAGHPGDTAQARRHIEAQLQMQDRSTAYPNQMFAGVDPTTALDSVMQNILTSFPGLQGMVQQMMTTTGGDGGGGIPAVMQQIQSVLYPLLNQAAQSDPDGANLQPAVTQIIQGFTGLTQALSRQAPSPVPGDTAPVVASVMDE